MATVERLIGVTEVAQIIGISESSVKQMARDGRLPMKKIGKLWRTRPSDIDEWYRTQVQSAKTDASPQRREQ
jgi:excisionase family DNA binding protein